MSQTTRLYAGRLLGMVVAGPDAEPIGRVRDIIMTVRPGNQRSRVLGLVVELTNKRRIFLPMLRIGAINPHEITLATGSVSMRAFAVRAGEFSLVNDILGTKVQVDDPDLPRLHGKAVEIADVEIERTRTRDWIITKAAVFEDKAKFGRKRELSVVNWLNVHGVADAGQGVTAATANIIATFDDMRPADIATMLHAMTPTQRTNVAVQLDDERLADVLQELPEDHQAELIEAISIERAADVLEEMDPDDAADLLSELDDAKADVLLDLMDPEESAPVRRLMKFDDDTVGAIMTPEPLVLTPQTTVAEALAMARNPDLPTSLSSLVFVVRPPTSTPTGSYLGCVHLQKLLREPPSELIGGFLDPDLPPLFTNDSVETAARFFATYNLVCGPVLDDDNHLLGAVSVDDLLDHMLPEDWREGGLRP